MKSKEQNLHAGDRLEKIDSERAAVSHIFGDMKVT
jgi:hypothetical protein